MAGQGVLIKYAASLKGLLVAGRGAVAFQQTAGLKHAAQTKLAELNLPEKPKRPVTPYFRFMLDFRTDILRKEPGLKVAEVTKRSSIEWSQLHEAIKEKYSADYRKEMEVYAKKSIDYNSKLTEEQKHAIKMALEEKLDNRKRREIKKRERDTNRPKRPLGPYLHYMVEQSKNSSVPYAELILKLRGSYAKLSEAEKERYKALHQADKQRYEKEMLDWEAKMLKEGNVDMIRHTSPVNKPNQSRLKKEKKPDSQ